MKDSKEQMKIWVEDKVIGSVDLEGSICDAAGKMVGHIYLYSGEVSVGVDVAGEMVVGSISHEGDIYDNMGKVGEVARSGNIWDALGRKVGWVAPLNYWKSATELYESHYAPVLLAGGAALLLVLKGTAVQPCQPQFQSRQRYQPTIPLTSHRQYTTSSLLYG